MRLLQWLINKHNAKILSRRGLVHCAYCKHLILIADNYCEKCGRANPTMIS